MGDSDVTDGPWRIDAAGHGGGYLARLTAAAPMRGDEIDVSVTLHGRLALAMHALEYAV